jgi:isochorismate synthase
MNEAIFGKIREAEKSNHDFAAWKLPGENEIHFISSEKSLRIDLSDLRFHRGFAIFPFENKKGWLIPGSAKAEIIPGDFVPAEITQFYYSKSEYLSVFEKFISAIRQRKFSKLVLSRVKKVVREEKISGSDLFSEMTKKYPDAFTYYLRIPEYGTWMGASPEKLIRFDKEKISTVSLAGTQKNSGIEPENAKWGSKEKEEQEIVTKYIEEKIKKNGFEEYQKKGPFTSKAGSLLHLKTEFEINRTNGSVYDLVHDLHPTPAVCGIPKEEAEQFILETEKHKRLLYTGFLGPVDKDYSGTLYVNLRCMQLSGNEANIFAGGGITIDSEGEKEWEETEMKTLIMHSLFNLKI